MMSDDYEPVHSKTRAPYYIIRPSELIALLYLSLHLGFVLLLMFQYALLLR